MDQNPSNEQSTISQQLLDMSQRLQQFSLILESNQSSSQRRRVIRISGVPRPIVRHSYCPELDFLIQKKSEIKALLESIGLNVEFIEGVLASTDSSERKSRLKELLFSQSLCDLAKFTKNDNRDQIEAERAILENIENIANLKLQLYQILNNQKQSLKNRYIVNILIQYYFLDKYTVKPSSFCVAVNKRKREHEEEGIERSFVLQDSTWVTKTPGYTTLEFFAKYVNTIDNCPVRIAFAEHTQPINNLCRNGQLLTASIVIPLSEEPKTIDISLHFNNSDLNLCNAKYFIYKDLDKLLAELLQSREEDDKLEDNMPDNNLLQQNELHLEVASDNLGYVMNINEEVLLNTCFSIDRLGRSPILLACKCSSLVLIKVLFKRVFKNNHELLEEKLFGENEFGETAIDFAASNEKFSFDEFCDMIEQQFGLEILQVEDTEDLIEQEEELNSRVAQRKEETSSQQSVDNSSEFHQERYIQHGLLDHSSESLFHKNYDALADLLDKVNVEHASKQIIVIGEQNSGKSSLVRRLIELNLVPVGCGPMTRHPCEICIRKDSSVAKGFFKVRISKKPAEWFLKQYGRISAVTPKPSDTASFELQTDEVSLSKGCQRIFSEVYSASQHLRLGNSQYIASFVTITISASHLESFTVVDIPGYVNYIPESHSFPDHIASEAIIANVLKDPKYSNAIVIGVVDSRKEANSENLFGLVNSLTTSDPSLKSRMIGVALKADAGPMAVQNTQIYLKNEILRCDLGFFAVVNPNPMTIVQSLHQAYGTNDLNVQEIGTKIEPDNTLWNFRLVEKAEEAFWQSYGMTQHCGVRIMKSELNKVLFDRMPSSLSIIDNKVKVALQHATDYIQTFPMLVHNLRTELTHSVTEVNVFEAIVSMLGDITSKSFDNLQKQLSGSKSNLVFSSSEIDPIAKVIDWIKVENKTEINNQLKLVIVLNEKSFIAEEFFEKEIIDTVHELLLRELAVKLQMLNVGMEETVTDSDSASDMLLDTILEQYNLKIEDAKKSANSKVGDFAKSIKLKDAVIVEQEALYKLWTHLHKAQKLLMLCNRNLADSSL